MTHREAGKEMVYWVFEVEEMKRLYNRVWGISLSNDKFCIFINQHIDRRDTPGPEL